MATCIRLSGLSRHLQRNRVDSSSCIRYWKSPTFGYNEIMYCGSRFMQNSRTITRHCNGNLHYRSQHMSKIEPGRCLQTNNPGTTKLNFNRTSNTPSRTRILRQLSVSCSQGNKILCDTRYQSRTFSTGSSSGGRSNGSSSSAAAAASGAGGEDDGSGSEDDAHPGAPGQQEPAFQPTALAPMTVPEVFPNVPIIAVRRNPVFPRFIKMIEVWQRSKYLFSNLKMYEVKTNENVDQQTLNRALKS